MSHNVGAINTPNVTLSANGTITVPAGHAIDSIVIENTTGNAITGGLKIGTTSGGTDVVVALAVAENALMVISDATLLKRVFSTTSSTTLYAQCVVAWNSASIKLYMTLRRFT